jgi:hypothetical protein
MLSETEVITSLLPIAALTLRPFSQVLALFKQTFAARLSNAGRCFSALDLFPRLVGMRIGRRRC